MRYYGMSNRDNIPNEPIKETIQQSAINPPVQNEPLADYPQNMTPDISRNMSFNLPQNMTADTQQNMTADTQQNMPHNTENRDYLEAQPQTPNYSDRIFNRPTGGDGIYNGQRAQNVRPVNEWLENLPPAVMPPGSNPSAMGLQNATVYEYPAPADHMQFYDIMEKPCPTQMNQVSFLCAHRGKVVKVEMGNGVTKSGILRNIHQSYIVLEEKGSGNRIMCNTKAVKSIDIFV